MTLIAQIAQLRHGGSHKLVGDLAKNKLIARVQHAKCNVYTLFRLKDSSYMPPDR